MAGKGPESSGSAGFSTTDWRLIAAARGDDVPQARNALSDLCAVYWYPLYAYIRRRDRSAEQAEDLTQGFFASLLGRDFLAGIAPEKGRFRSFLLTSLQNYIANERDRDNARKRGGGQVIVSIDLLRAERRYAAEPAHMLTAERLFERRWALTLLERVLDGLRTEMARLNQERLFDRLSQALLAGGEAIPHAQVAVELGMTDGAVRVAALRLRRRFRELVRAEVARTVQAPEEVDDEIRNLFAAVAP